MIVDPKPRGNQLNLRRNISGIYFFTLCFYTYYFFACYFDTYQFFNLLKSACWATRCRGPEGSWSHHVRGMGMIINTAWRRAAPA
jgi:hypothetical protein